MKNQKEEEEEDDDDHTNMSRGTDRVGVHVLRRRLVRPQRA